MRFLIHVTITFGTVIKLGRDLIIEISALRVSHTTASAAATLHKEESERGEERTGTRRTFTVDPTSENGPRYKLIQKQTYGLQ